jgi:putative ABC transport system ATP-binding protein
MLELDHISVSYLAGTPAEVRALDDVSLHAPSGQFITVIGANGSGKSTLVGVLAGNVTPGCGRILIDGRDVSADPVHRRARFVARVFDDPRVGSAPGLSVEENLALAMARGKRRGLRRAVTSRRRLDMREALSVLGLGLEDRLAQPVGLLSAGQRQSLTMVMAALKRPSLLLLDEHTAALDPATAARVLELTALVANTASATTVMVTHDMAAALATGDRLVIMRSGRIAADLTADERRQLDVADLIALLHPDNGAGPSHASGEQVHLQGHGDGGVARQASISQAVARSGR